MTEASKSPQTNYAPAPAPAVGPGLALLLSLVVLPGLGQLLTGRLRKGAIMVGVLAIWLPVALVKLGRDMSVIMPDLLARSNEGAAITLAEIQNALAPMATGITWIFFPLLVIWFWALFDSIIYFIQIREAAKP